MNLITAMKAFNDILAGPYLLGFIIIFIGVFMVKPVLVWIGTLLVGIVLFTAFSLTLR
jgi:hypothetical protein